MSLGRVLLVVAFVASMGLNTWLLVRRQGEASRPRAATKEEARAPAGAGDAGAVEHIAGERRDLLDSVERDWLQRAGFAAPAESLRADLLRHPELVPTEGVLGGTMAFRPDAIYVLPGGHVWAIADDGHIETAVLLRYAVKRDTTVQWSVEYHRTEP